MPFILYVKVNSMNTKTKYLIPAIAAVFALTLVFATPYVIAEEGDSTHAKWGAKDHKMHHSIAVEGFVGAIPLPEEFSKEAMIGLKDQVTVTLSQALSAAEAAEGFNADDIMKAGIGIVKGQDDQKFVAWTLASMNMDVDAQTATATIFVVDAGNKDNTATVQKEFDPTMKDRHMGKYSMHDKANFQDLDEDTKAELKSAFQSLKDARASGDQAQIDTAKANLKSLLESIKAQN